MSKRNGLPPNFVNKEPPILPGCTVLRPMKQKQSERLPANGKKQSKKESSGRFIVLNNFVDCTMQELNRSEIMVWFVLYRDTREGLASVSQVDIGRRAKLSTKTVRRAIQKLRHYGLLKLVYHGGLNKGLSKYRVVALKKTAGEEAKFGREHRGHSYDPSTGDISRPKLGS